MNYKHSTSCYGKFCAFSLIEILISLIIISLLVAAFTPIITKKLKASDISIGSFGNGSNVNITLERQVTKEDCDKYDALFIPAAMNGGVRNLCVTKYNMGDNELPLAESVKKLNVGQTCNDKDKGNCCWSGNTSTTCTTGKNGDGDYSGCNRTVCQFAAANASCASYAPNDENEGSWRLATIEEQTNWGNNLTNLQTNKGKNGLQMCSLQAVDGSDTCDYAENCIGANDNNRCYPYAFITGDGEGAHHYFSEGKLIKVTSTSDNFASSTRCVLDSIAVDISELPNGGGIKDPTVNPFYGEPKDQADCDKIVAIFIDKKMSGANRNICVSKYNVGDAGPDGFGPPIPESFTQYIMNIGQSCPYNGSCCWKGKTAGTCGITGNAGANYSGCNRTVCQWNAANAACREYNAFGATAKGAWRLPKISEYSVWAQNFNVLNNNKGKDGLQLCTREATGGYVQCYYAPNCPGSAGGSYSAGYCFPHHNWTESSAGSGNMYYAPITPNISSSMQHTLAASARCVYDGITKANNYEEDLSGYDDSNAPKDEPKSQADCEKLTAIFVHKKYAGGMRNLCVSKYNVGDSGPSGSGPKIPDSYKNYVLNVGQSCPHSGYCCWKGKTAAGCSMTGNAGADYSGCNRTVCQWTPANESCLSWTANGKTQAGSWRLPTQAEYSSMANYFNIINNDRGKDGLQLCTHTPLGGYVQCEYIGNCPGSASGSYSNGYCFAHHNWTETSAGTNIYYAPITPNSTYSANHTLAASARCVYDGTVRKKGNISDYDDSNAPDDEPKSQADCDKLTAIFAHKKYTGGGRNLCISKYNVGDNGPNGSGPNIPSEYKQYSLTAGQSCPKAGYCCWSGATAQKGSCGMTGNAGADYSGCNRTVCQWNVSNASCKRYTAGGKTPSNYWRLPTNSEFTNMTKYMEEINNNRGKDGLQLCTREITSGYVQCYYVGNCPGSASTSYSNGYCFAHHNWTQSSAGSNVYYAPAMPDNVYSGTYTLAASARCVYDGQENIN